MTEFNGNPESGVDQLLNRSENIDLPSDTKPSYEELEKKLALITTDRDFWFDSAKKYRIAIDTAKESIEEVLAGDDNPEQTYDDFKDAFEALGVELVQSVELVVTASWYVTVKVPMGTEVGSYDFSADLDCDYEVESDSGADIDVERNIY